MICSENFQPVDVTSTIYGEISHAFEIYCEDIQPVKFNCYSRTNLKNVSPI